MSKFLLKCTCINCKKEYTVQSLKAHYNKCTIIKPLTNTCIQCGKDTNNPSYCSRSCRTTYVNYRRPRNQKPLKLTIEEQTAQRFNAGTVESRSTLRIYLAKQNGYQCAICSLSNWLDKPITLVVDHINGDASNNFPENLRLLCPNCNSQTPTFAGRNKGNGRGSRGLPLH